MIKSQRKRRKNKKFKTARKQFSSVLLTRQKKTKDLYIENYKTLMKEIKEDTNGEIYHVHGSEESIQ